MEFNSGFKGLNAELNPTCHLLALLGAHPILHISRIKVNLVNYFCCNLYCFILLLYNAQYLLLEFVVLTFVYCIVLCLFVLFMCYVFFPTIFTSNCCMTQFVDLGNYMCVCMYACTCTIPEIWFGHWLSDFFLFFSAPIPSHLTLMLLWRWIPKSLHLLRYKFYLQTHPVSTDFFYQFYITNIAKTFSSKLHRSVETRRKPSVWFSAYSEINLLRWVLPTHTRTVEIQGKYRHLKHFQLPCLAVNRNKNERLEG